MVSLPDHGSSPAASPVLSNAEIADRLASLAQLLSAQKENSYKVKAYQRAAARIRNLSESLDEMVRDQEDLTRFAGIGEAIAALERSLHVDLDVEEGRFRYREVLEALIRPWFEERSFAEVTSSLEAAKVLWGPYRTVEGLVTDPTSILHQTDLMVDVAQPGVGTFPVPRPVLSFGAWEGGVPRAAPVLGQDTDEVLTRLLGLSDVELAGLRARSVIGGAGR